MDKGVKILIADDSLFMRTILREMLEGASYTQISECEDGEECLKLYETEKPDLILLDLIMPKMDGLEVLKKIGRSVKILVISAVGQEKMIEEVKQFGASGYILKPFENEVVLGKIKEILAS